MTRIIGGGGNRIPTISETYTDINTSVVDFEDNFLLSSDSNPVGDFTDPDGNEINFSEVSSTFSTSNGVLSQGTVTSGAYGKAGFITSAIETQDGVFVTARVRRTAGGASFPLAFSASNDIDFNSFNNALAAFYTVSGSSDVTWGETNNATESGWEVTLNEWTTLLIFINNDEAYFIEYDDSKFKLQWSPEGITVPTSIYGVYTSSTTQYDFDYFRAGYLSSPLSDSNPLRLYNSSGNIIITRDGTVGKFRIDDPNSLITIGSGLLTIANGSADLHSDSGHTANSGLVTLHTVQVQNTSAQLKSGFDTNQDSVPTYGLFINSDGFIDVLQAGSTLFNNTYSYSGSTSYTLGTIYTDSGYLYVIKDDSDWKVVAHGADDSPTTFYTAIANTSQDNSIDNVVTAQLDAPMDTQNNFVQYEDSGNVTLERSANSTGTWNYLNGTDEYWKIEDGSLVAENVSGVSWGDVRIAAAGMDRSAGLAISWSATKLGGAGLSVGFATSQTGGLVDHNLALEALSGQLRVRLGSDIVRTGLNHVAFQTRELSIVVRDTGAFFFTSELGLLLWVDESDTTSTLYPHITTNTDASFNYYNIIQLDSIFTETDALQVFEETGSVPNGTELDTIATDTFLRWTIGDLSVDRQVALRYQDSNNHYYVIATTTGDLELYKVVGGTTTLLVSSAAVLSGNETITVIVDSNEFQVYYDTTLEFTESAANEHQDSTTVRVQSDGITDVKCWYRDSSDDPDRPDLILSNLAQESPTQGTIVLQDDFNDDVLSEQSYESTSNTRTADTGQWIVVNENDWRIYSNRLESLSSAALISSNTYKMTSSDIAHLAYLSIKKTSGSNNAGFGFEENASGVSEPTHSFIINDADIEAGGITHKSSTFLADNQNNDFLIVSRYDTLYYLQRVGSSWEVAWIESHTLNKPNLKLYASGSGFEFSNVQLLSDTTQWNQSDIFQVFEESGTISAGTEQDTSSADFVMQINIDALPSSGAIDIIFRDALTGETKNVDTWKLVANDNGSLALLERESSSNTQVASAGAGTVSDGDTITIIADNDIINVYVNNTSAMSYTSASFNLNETATSIHNLSGDGEISDWRCWYRTLDDSPTSEASDLDALFITDDNPSDDVYYLLQDNFYTTEAAPLASPRTAEPGLGTATITDSGNNLSIDADGLKAAALATGYVDPRYVYSFVERTAGLALVSALGVTGDVPVAAFSTTTTGGVSNFESGVRIRVDNAYSIARDFLPILGSAADKDPVAVVLRDTGAFLLAKQSGNWVLLWVDDTGSTSTLYPTITWGSANNTAIGFFRLAQLPSPWNQPNAVQVFEEAGSVLSGTSQDTDSADFVMRWTNGDLTADRDVAFRYQDANNYWFVRAVNTSGDLELTKVISGTPTTVATDAGVLAGSETITVIADDESIVVFYDTTKSIDYATASELKTQTGTETQSAGINDWKCWYRYVSDAPAPASSLLDTVSS